MHVQYHVEYHVQYHVEYHVHACGEDCGVIERPRAPFQKSHFRGRGQYKVMSSGIQVTIGPKKMFHCLKNI